MKSLSIKKEIIYYLTIANIKKNKPNELIFNFNY